MREILFRGKTEKGEWVYGDLLHPDNCGNGYSIEDFTKDKNNCFEVIPTSISEFTGLYDKNGKKIFEGDICQTKGYKLINEKPFEIVWNDYYSGWFWQDIEVPRETDTLTKTVAELTEVIGNIHDNPELIGGGEDA